MRSMDCFPSDFQRVIGAASFWFLVVFFPPCYFVATNLKVNIVFLKIDSICLTSTLFFKKRKIKSRNVQNIVQHVLKF